MGLAAVSFANAICTKTEPRRPMTIQPTTPIQLAPPSGPENDHDALARCGGHVLIVDDDPAIRKMITRYFEEQDMPVVAVPGRQELNQQLGRAEPGLIVLDLRLGQEDGLDLLREIRARSDVPIIIMTGHRRDEVDRVVGLELGADDYITKPFGLRELLARVRAILRRQEIGRAARQRDPERGGYRFNGWVLERRGRRLTDSGGEPVPLTKSEYALLLAFLEAPQRTLSREHLLQATRIHEDIFDRSIDVQVLRLRRKLEPNPSAPQIIKTERGLGYVFSPSVEAF
jgi:two-component system OmpR family response regulator